MDDAREPRLGSYLPLAAELVAEAKALAAAHGHAEVAPLHLLACAVRKEQIAQALRDTGADPAPILDRLEPELRARQPGRSAVPRMSVALAELLLRAEARAIPEGAVRAEDLWYELSWGGVVESIIGRSLRSNGLSLRERPLAAPPADPDAASPQIAFGVELGPVAAELLEGAWTLADERGHERVEPIHLLAFGVWHPAVARALREAGWNTGAMAREAQRRLGTLHDGASPEPSEALRAVFARAVANAEQAGHVGAADLWRALGEEPNHDVERALTAGQPSGAGTLPRVENIAEEELSALADPVDPQRYAPLALELLSGAAGLAADRGHALVTPVHVLAYAARRKEIAAALDDASADAEVLVEEAEEALAGSPRDPPPRDPPPRDPPPRFARALVLMLERAALARGSEKVRGEDVWRALVEEIVGPTARIFEESGFRRGEPLLAFGEA
jgi:ATP-dependent Clp protease ATP-binding subunit ClpA